MALGFSDNVGYTGTLPNFERDMYQTLADMLAVKKTKMPAMFVGMCIETGKVYLYDKNNESDPVLGLWREIGAANEVAISEENGNIIIENDDGLFAKIAVSAEEGNDLEEKDDGLFVKVGVKTVNGEDPDADGNVVVAKYEIMTQEAYDGLAEKDENTLYLIKE